MRHREVRRLIPKFVKEIYRKFDNFDYLKDDLREGFSVDETWYQQVVMAVDELSEIKRLGLSEKDFKQLVTYFENNYSKEDKEELLVHKYDGLMSQKDKAMEALLDYFNEIFERFSKKVVCC